MVNYGHYEGAGIWFAPCGFLGWKECKQLINEQRYASRIAEHKDLIWVNVVKVANRDNFLNPAEIANFSIGE